MDIYSSDRKLSELGMAFGMNRHDQQPYQNQSSSSSSSPITPTSPTCGTTLTDFDNCSTFGTDVLGYFDTDFGSSKIYNGFGTAIVADDNNNNWMEFLNPLDDGRSTTADPDNNQTTMAFSQNIYLVEDGLEFLEGPRIKMEEHSYSLGKDDELSEFKLNFDGDLELFQTAEMEEDSFTEAEVVTKTNADEMDEFLFVETHCLDMTTDQGLTNENTMPHVGSSLLDDVNPEVDMSTVGNSRLNRQPYQHQTRQQNSNKRKWPVGETSNNTVATTNNKSNEDYLLSMCTIKTEPSEDIIQDDLLYSGNLMGSMDEGALPPTPPSSGCGVNSDSECSNGELSGPPSPPAMSRDLRHVAKHQDGSSHVKHQHLQPFFSSPIPSSGILILSEEEKRTLLAEGYSLPSKLPLSKQEEKNLKKIRRKIKNKISAQESRRKKKEYLESLEKKVEQISQENSNLKKRVNLLESNNRSLISELQKLQSLASKVMRSSSSSLSSSSSSLSLSSSSSSSSSLKANLGASCIIVK